MNRITEVFGVSHVLLPVIHPVSRDTALASIASVHEAGVKGVWLIDQGMQEGELLQLAREVHDRHPTLWIGLNLLSRSPLEALTLVLNMSFIGGLWTDDAGIDEHQPRLWQTRAGAFTSSRNVTGWWGLYFGGVAFKYQRPVAPEDLGRAAEAAVSHVDVLCTSGPGTGHAADVAKVRALRGGFGDRPIALASGVTAENVRSYMPYVQAFLVGTGLESRLGVIDPGKLAAMIRAMQRESALDA